MSKLIANFMASVYKIFDFKGRSSRSEYWYATLAWILSFFMLSIATTVVSSISETIGFEVLALPILLFDLVFYLAFLISSVSLGIRRLHDIGVTGWLYCIGFTGIGNIALIIMFCMDSQPGFNKYGANQKGV